MSEPADPVFALAKSKGLPRIVDVDIAGATPSLLAFLIDESRPLKLGRGL